MEKIIKTQKELDAIPLDYDGYIYIEGGTENDPLELRTNYQQATVIVRGRAYLSYVRGSATIRYVYGSATIGYVCDSATIRDVYGSATIGYVRDSATIGDVRDSATIRYVYGSATIRDVRDSATIRDVRGSATIRYVYGSATIGYVCDSATIRDVCDSATIRDVRDSATIGDVRDSATIRYVYGSATIGYVRDSATIRYVYGSATIRDVYGSATIGLFGEAVISNSHSAKAIVCHGYNTVVVHKSDKERINLVINKDSHLIVLPDRPKKYTFKEWAKYYPVEVTGVNAILYKAVHKRDGRYYSDQQNDFEYKIGETKTEKCAPVEDGSCAQGLHVATRGWAVRYGCGWSDYALLECEVPIKSLVIAADTDGKVRTSKLKVLRDVTDEKI